MPKVQLQPVGIDEPVNVDLVRVTDAGRTRYKAAVADHCLEFEHIGESPTSGCLLVHGRVVPYVAVRRDDEVSVWIDGRTYQFRLVDRVARRVGTGDASAAASNRIVAPMPGTILKLNAKPGATFAAKEPLIVMESMKMEMSLTSPTGGRVVELLCKVGELVDRGALLATLELDDAAKK